MWFECKLWHLWQELLRFERHWSFAAGSLKACPRMGSCLQDVHECHRILVELDRRQQIVEENEPDIRSALNVPLPGEVWNRMIEENGCWFYETVRNVRIALHVQERALDVDIRSTIRTR